MRSNKPHRDRNHIEKLLALTPNLKAGPCIAQTKQAHMAKALIDAVVW